MSRRLDRTGEMTNALRWLLGIPNDETVPSQLHIEWLSLPSNDTAFFLTGGLLSVILCLWLLFRYEARNLSKPARIGLFGLRTATILLVIVMLCEPVILLSRGVETPSNLLVLTDHSKSLDLRDRWEEGERTRKTVETLALPNSKTLSEMTRRQIVDHLLERSLTEQLESAASRTVHHLPFSESLDRQANVSVLDDENATSLNRNSTAIGTVIRDTMQRFRGLPIAGILLISDGQSNLGEQPESAAQWAADQGILVHALAIGTLHGPQDTSLVAIETNPIAFANDLISVTALVQSTSTRNVDASIVFEKQRMDGSWREIERQVATLSGDGTVQEVTFTHSEETPGEIDLRIRVEDAGAELTLDNNQRSTHVQVVSPNLRVLFLAGSTFPEVQFIRNSLMLDKAIDLSTWNQSAEDGYEHPGNTPITRLPNTYEELDRFDCVLLYDPDPAKWPPTFSEMLERFVSFSGGGLVYIAGEIQTERSFASRNRPDMSWLELLPIVQDPGLFRSNAKVRLSTKNAWRLLITEAGRDSHILQFSPDRAANDRILGSLPGMYWHFPVTRAKASATVLARHGDPRMKNQFGPEVVLASQRVGPGRTFFVGFDSTYRWRYVDEQTFDGFWARIVEQSGRAKQLGSRYPFRLRTDKMEYAPGDTVQIITTEIQQIATEEPIGKIQIEVDDGVDDTTPTRLSLLTTDNSPENAETFIPQRPGNYMIRAWAGDENSDPPGKTVTHQFQVKHRNTEFDNPTLNLDLLENIASITGGRVFGLHEADQISDAFPIRTNTHETVIRRDLWSSPSLVTILVLLLTTEWIVRKRLALP